MGVVAGADHPPAAAGAPPQREGVTAEVTSV